MHLLVVDALARSASATIDVRDSTSLAECRAQVVCFSLVLSACCVCIYVCVLWVC